MAGTGGAFQVRSHDTTQWDTSRLCKLPVTIIGSKGSECTSSLNLQRVVQRAVLIETASHLQPGQLNLQLGCCSHVGQLTVTAVCCCLFTVVQAFPSC